MKVNDLSRLAQVQRYQQAQRTKSNGQEMNAAEPKLDGVSISPEALKMAQGNQELPNEDGSERVGLIKQAIQNGTYQPNLRDVANALLSEIGPFRQ